MNELNKTVTFVGVALLLGVVAFASAPRRAVPDLFFDVGEPFFPDFTDPEAAATLDVVEFDEETAAATPFRVTHRGGSGRFPRTTTTRPTAPSACRTSPRTSSAWSRRTSAPTTWRTTKRSASSTRPIWPPDLIGRGTRVTVEDASGEVLADLIVGRPVENRPGLRFVRAPEQNGSTRPASRRTSRPASRTGSSRTCWRSSGTRWSTSS